MSHSSPTSMLSMTAAGWSHFRFDHGITPLSYWPIPIITCLTYLLIVAGLKSWINHPSKAFNLKKIVIVYNFIMSFLSGVLFLFLLRELCTIWSRESFLDLFCDPHIHHTTGRLILFYYINYIFKYVELIDTVFLCLRYKQTPFIHVYHHAITLMLCWTQLTVQTCMQWVIIVINLFVHIFLYSYYAVYELKVDIWWKKYLTIVQIIQFMIALIASISAMAIRIIWEMVPLSWGWGAPCHGQWIGSYFGLAIIISYLYLFMKLYQEKYEQDSKKTKSDKHQTTMTLKQSTSPSTSSLLTTPPTTSPVQKACPTLFTPEDQFASHLTRWSQHPLIVADRLRWQDHQAANKEVMNSNEAVSIDQTESPSIAVTSSTSTPSGDMGLKKRVFGTDAHRL